MCYYINSMYRYEQINLDSLDKYEKTDEGFIRIPARVTRSGVFLYKKADGSYVRELRPKAEVFNEDSLKSILGKIITNEHPIEMITAENAKEYQVGFIGDSVEVVDDKYVRVPLTITDKNTITEIENGKKELSCGYRSVVFDKKGIEENEEYDSVQTEIRYNHVAIVNKGRAGSMVRIDNEDAVLVSEEEKPNKKNMEENMENKEKLDSLEKKVIELKADSKNYEEEITGLKAKLDSLDEEKKEVEQELEEAKAKLDSFDSNVIEKAKERAELIKLINDSFEIEQEKLDGMSNDEMKVEYIQSKTDSFELVDADSKLIDVAFKAVKSIKKAEKVDSIGAEIVGARNENIKMDSATNKNTWLETRLNNWKGE